ncbi:peptide/nickel transport system permease protein [Actinocorallia herbida]|uniref:Peptide/nickel transport system permease protein n=1 Tax=Actinocorallia herbida TaxID=58109 RepID=A0A3N1DB82_9ACTN|nr:ABC transporter permease [Actinocorallia herbida]ROO90783.1 peptide/nickel transport system permease protein [Actinocorallia herbida]
MSPRPSPALDPAPKNARAPENARAAAKAAISAGKAGRAGRPVRRGGGARHVLRLRVSAVLVALIALGVVLVPVGFPLDQQAVDLRSTLEGPSWTHPFGTDGNGRDVLLRCVYGLRVSLLVGLVAALGSAVIGTVIGSAAALFGGRVDRLVMRVVDTFSAVPHLMLGIFIVAMFRPGVWPVVMSIGLTHWLSTTRIVRAEVLSLRARPFVDAAISGGASRLRVATRHLVPAVLPQAGLAAVLLVPHAIWHETALSFLGLGLPSHQASLGNMISDARGTLLAGHWWPTLFPGLFIIVPTLAIAGLAGAWRERLNPRRRSELML